MSDLWYGTSGPPDAPIVIVGEAWGAEEDAAKRPFVGQSGVELDRMLAEAGLSRRDILCTNVVAARPQSNEMFRFFEPRDSKPQRIRGLAPGALVRSEVSRLYSQIAAAPRKLVIATGNYALWALSDCTTASIQYSHNNRTIPKPLQTWAPAGIMSWRGSMWYCSAPPGGSSPPIAGIPLLPIIHPAAILRDWSERAVTVHDLRARVPKALADDWRPSVPPRIETRLGFQELIDLLQRWREEAERSTSGLPLAVDIETARSFMTCLGIASSPSFAVSIPFITRQASDSLFGSRWSVEEEAAIIRALRRLLSHPKVSIYGQNFIYDTQYIQHWHGFTPRLDHDTMLAQNVLFPGTPKDLGYLSSLYCDYHWYWKEDHKEWDLRGDLDTLLHYNAEDCLRTYEIALRQKEVIAATGMEAQMALKMKINALCLRMMNRGVRVDSAKRGAMVAQLSDCLNGLYSELLTIVPQAMVKPDADKPWYRSPQQTSFLFYDQLAMRVVKHRKTKKPTVGKEALMQLEKWYPEFTGLFHRLDLAGSVENTVDVLKAPLDPDGRMRCSYNPGGTETHRLSSSRNAFGRGTNIQNLTKGEEDD